MLRTTLLAAAAMLPLAASAQAASVELRAGPLTPTPAQVARLALSTIGGFACRATLAFLSGPVGEDGAVALARHPVSAGDGSLRGGAALVGYHDPDLMPALVHAQAVVQCPSVTAAQIRDAVQLTLEIAAGRTSAAAVALQGQ